MPKRALKVDQARDCPAPPPYVQQPLPDFGPAPIDRPATPGDEARRQAVDASARYLDRIEARAHTAPGIRDADRADALAELLRRRQALRKINRA